MTKGIETAWKENRPGSAPDEMVEIELLLTSNDATVALRLRSPKPMEVIWFFASESVVT